MNAIVARLQLTTSRELKREQAWSRINLVPLILAEQDRDAYRRTQAALAREKEIMKDVPHWEVRVVASLFPSIDRTRRCIGCIELRRPPPPSPPALTPARAR